MRTSKSCISGFATGVSVLLILPGFALAGVTSISQTKVQNNGGFPFEITKPGSYRLTSNLFVPNDTDGIVTTSPDVRIDLNGFRLFGKNKCTYTEGEPASVTCNGNNTSVGINGAAEVRNGAVNGFGTGIRASNIAVALKVQNVTLTHHGIHAISVSGSNLLLTDSILSTNGSRGVDGQFGTGTYIVTGNLVEKNGQLGVYLSAGVASHNTFYQNVGEGIRSNVGRGTIIENNYFESNGEGIVGNGAVGYRGNTFLDNETNVSGGTNLGGNLCDFSVCP